jgi:hypothetical protein
MNFQCNLCREELEYSDEYLFHVKMHFQSLMSRGRLLVKCGYRGCKDGFECYDYKSLKYHLARRNTHKILNKDEDRVKCDFPTCNYEVGLSKLGEIKNHYVNHLNVNENISIECIFSSCQNYSSNVKTTYRSNMAIKHGNLTGALKEKYYAKRNDAASNQTLMVTDDNFVESDVDCGQNVANIRTGPQFDKLKHHNQMRDFYLATFLKYKNMYHIPKYQCEAIFRDFMYFEQLNIENFKNVFKETLATYKIETSIADILLNQLEISNNFFNIHNKYKSDYKKVILAYIKLIFHD